MRRKITVFLILLLSLVTCLSAHVSAEDIYAENIAAINAAASELGGIMDGYADSDTSADKRISIKTNAVIVEYLGRINALRVDERVASEDISDEARLLTLKGSASGECAFVFESKKDELSSEAAERVSANYENTLSEIDAALSYEELSEAQQGYVAGVILSVYEEKVDALLSSADSETVVGIAEQGTADMRELSLNSLDLAEYDRIYERVARQISVQREREIAISRFAIAYELIFGEGSFEADKGESIISEFLSSIDSAESIESFNSLIERFILCSLDMAIEGSGDYSRELHLEFTSDISGASAAASARGDILDLTSVLENAHEKIFIAELKDKSVERVNALFSEMISEIEAKEYISEAQKRSFSARLEDAKDVAFHAVATGSTAQDIEGAISDFADAAERIREETQAAENAALMIIERAREEHFLSLEAVFSSYLEADYSEVKYAQIRKAYERALSEIAAAGGVEEFALSLSIAKSTMEAVVPLFEERRAELLENLSSVYTELKGISVRYSEESLALLEQTYSKAKEEIEGLDRSIGIEVLIETAESRMSAMKAIKTIWVGCGEVDIGTSGFTQYPAGFDHSASGYWGVVKNDKGLPFDIRLSISDYGDISFYKKSLRDAIKGARISYMGDVPMSDREIQKKLESLEIKRIFSIKLTKEAAIYSEFSGEYTVKVLLPESLRAERVLRVVHIMPDGSAEYYDAWCEGGFLVFKTTHFSDFLILGESEAGLLPIIAILIVIGIAELTAVLVLRRRVREAATSLYSIAPLSVLGLSVSGGLPIVILLLLCDLSLGVYILILLKEIKIRKRAPLAVAEVRAEHELPKREAKAEFFEERKAPDLLPIYLDRVSAEDADSLVEDSKVSALLQISGESPKICRGCKKTFINVDTISESFERGETVSLRTLKEKGLIPMSACYLKVLARGVIDKPLTVKAQSFSKNAVKMISLTGGQAILEGNSPEEK